VVGWFVETLRIWLENGTKCASRCSAFLIQFAKTLTVRVPLRLSDDESLLFAGSNIGFTIDP
jgi:hypothetical protein